MELQSYARTLDRAGRNLTAIRPPSPARPSPRSARRCAISRDARSCAQGGRPALRAMTFHQRAKMLKALADAIMARKEELYELSYRDGRHAGPTAGSTSRAARARCSAYASKGRRELPNDTHPDRRRARRPFQARHLRRPARAAPRCRARRCTSTPSTSPSGGCWRSSPPRCSPACPPSSSPRPRRAYLAEAAFRILIDANVLPEGALQLIVGPRRRSVRSSDRAGRRVLHRLGRDRGRSCSAIPSIARESVRFIAERDSLNAVGARPGCGARDAGIRSLHQGSRARDDGEGGAEMHRHPPRLRARRR